MFMHPYDVATDVIVDNDIKNKHAHLTDSYIARYGLPHDAASVLAGHYLNLAAHLITEPH